MGRNWGPSLVPGFGRAASGFHGNPSSRDPHGPRAVSSRGPGRPVCPPFPPHEPKKTRGLRGSAPGPRVVNA